MTGRDLVQRYLSRGWRLVFWAQAGDAKGPKGADAKSWTTRTYGLDDYDALERRGPVRVGAMLGHEVEPGRFLHDVDFDGPNAFKFAAIFPNSGYAFGRASKPLSHLFFTCSQPLPSLKLSDPVDGATVIELRGTGSDGDVCLQTMIPPSVWTKGDATEPLTFIRGRDHDPGHVEDAEWLPRLV